MKGFAQTGTMKFIFIRDNEFLVNYMELVDNHFYNPATNTTYDILSFVRMYEDEIRAEPWKLKEIIIK